MPIVLGSILSFPSLSLHSFAFASSKNFALFFSRRRPLNEGAFFRAFVTAGESRNAGKLQRAVLVTRFVFSIVSTWHSSPQMAKLGDVDPLPLGSTADILPECGIGGNSAQYESVQKSHCGTTRINTLTKNGR